MDCDIKITVGTIWFGLDCMRACMSRCFESELQDKTLLASDDLGDGSLILFFHSRWLVAFLHDADGQARERCALHYSRPPHIFLSLVSASARNDAGRSS